MNLIDEIKKLNFQSKDFIIVGSGPMVIRGLKELNDIDIVVSKELFNECKKDDKWKQISWTYPDHIGQIYLESNPFELYLDVNCGSFNPTFEELMERSDLIEGIHFTSMKDVLQFKKAYNRPKHEKDIKIIEEYLLSHSPSDFSHII
jgi:hypothetical protein